MTDSAWRPVLGPAVASWAAKPAGPAHPGAYLILQNFVRDTAQGQQTGQRVIALRAACNVMREVGRS